MSRYLRALCVALLAALSFGCFAQDVPSGVNYKKASAEVNAKARAALEQALSGSPVSGTFFKSAIMCGPMLWRDLKDNHKQLSKDSTPVNIMLPGQPPIQAEGRGLRTDEQKALFWKLVLEKFPALKNGVVRPAKANEIQYFWYTIPFDIEEPFFAIETPTDVFIANIADEKGVPSLMWIDRVDNLTKLAK